MSRNTHKGVRIIGGKWRGRRLPVPDLPGLRPSGDRSRETLFNWLQACLHQANVVDLFAGTGVLGLEALSRGAGQVTLVERSAPACRSIEQSIAKLQSDLAQVVQRDALEFLAAAPAQAADLIFLDPPFGEALQQLCLELMDQHGWLTAGGLVYVEMPRSGPPLPLPEGWSVQREKAIGEVQMLLLKKN